VTKDVPAGKVVGDYIGKVITEAEEDKYDNDGHFYLMYYHNNASIYPNLRKPGIHLINHSCTPNVWMYTYMGHTLYFAIRHIFAGEEINVSYLLSPQDKDCKPCNHLCHCNGVICYHTMHLSEEQYDRWITFHDKEAAKTKRSRVAFGKTLPLLAHYPEAIEDNPVYTLFGATHEKPEIMTDTSVPDKETLRRTIRETGRTLFLPKLNLLIYGIQEDLLISTHK